MSWNAGMQTEYAKGDVGSKLGVLYAAGFEIWLRREQAQVRGYCSGVDAEDASTALGVAASHFNQRLKDLGVTARPQEMSVTVVWSD